MNKSKEKIRSTIEFIKELKRKTEKEMDKIGICDLCGKEKILEPLKVERAILKICSECRSWRKIILKNKG